ncbi:alpha-galactosidase [Candidatus Enterococcus willemsii]|uniref:Alpha-galactosidase n=1 Tax=Candidatus Enterococcus willemsii TaxID=1857215 RepID=A0ABQ6YWC3_9ENTE|nr:alpha-galactosidase [Enterococcus sp. CU12B]KAF1301987.1 alpha-galactosidase [Enterococcus sp. CU12B]
MITYNEQTQTFHLKNNKISYILGIEENNYLTHLYFGKKINHYSGNYRYPRTDRSFSPNAPNAVDRLLSLDTLPLEFPGYGYGDFREPAHNIKLANGSRINDFRYESYEIQQGKPQLSGLPALYTNEESEAETLIIQLKDDVSGLKLRLLYSIYQNQSAIIRSSQIVNESQDVVEINRLASQSTDFPNREFELIHLNGTWARERQLTREKVHTGIKVLDSKRGSSSHQQNPFVALVESTTTEFQGEAYGFNLVYSGNHETVIQKDPFNQTRIISGINSFNFGWQLQPNESFQTPEVVMVYSQSGLNDLSQTYHHLFNHHLVRGKYRLQERPTLINNWEATYFDFNEEKIMSIVNEASELGIEMFVLDDGWFGNREDDFTSLGDWFETEGKLACGLVELANQIHDKGMKFGIWFEPEMVSENSELFRAHPDWALAVPNREKSLSRSQYVLDFSRADVRENIYQQMTAIFDRIPIDYVKWDMNRNMTEVYSILLDPTMQGEVAHRYMLGLYEFLEKLTNAYPNILFESCSGGGGRFDAGFLYYMPQTWTSDNTDAVARLKIQYGTSLTYPISSMGAHVSAVPNHQTGRNTSLEIRSNAAMSGVFGYELDLTQLTSNEKTEIKEQVAFYKKHRQLLQFGTFYRLESPFEGNDTAWMFVSEDQSEAMVFYFRVLAEASHPLVTLKLAGLLEDATYQLNDIAVSGDELMNLGFYIDSELHGDYATQRFYLRKI